MEDCNRAIELDPDFAGAYINRGAVYRNKGEYDRAIKDYNIAIKLNPNLIEVYVNRGAAYIDRLSMTTQLKTSTGRPNSIQILL